MLLLLPLSPFIGGKLLISLSGGYYRNVFSETAEETAIVAVATVAVQCSTTNGGK